ncbi:efflux RND transporter permease subunit [Oceanibaculum pacificum]|uniref:Multidrug transporter AcrB n=1 Tax=Oceanibaculum pacificum TaxID=580166 RepID=A0A154WGK2_9PROT|nr:efflux RND transporter permease subunit [Oceanibaculum pacificum]KZD12585.1 multidrug transporter AcrB [Oceanibaculum pacificum]
MNLSELCVRRPVFATVMSLLIVLVGLVSYDRLPVREYPNIDEPVVSVQTDYLGASAEIIESQVTQVLETSIAGIEGIETIISQSRQERSSITVRFRLSTDPDVAASDVRDRVSRVRGRLPEEIDEPVISKVEADASPILFIGFSAPGRSQMELSDYADRFFVDRLQTLPGLAEVRIYGERRFSMRIWIDRAKLAAYNLTVQDVEAALAQQNVEIPSGRIESLNREFTVLSRTNLLTPSQFENIVLKEANGFQVKLRDVGRAELGPEDTRRRSRYNGSDSVTMGVVKQATANPLEVSRAVQAELPNILADLPSDMKAELAYDTSVFIERSIDNVFTTIAEAIVLVILVIFFFLRSFRATVIPLVTIPVSLIGAFILMYMMGFSVNTLTLLAMVLAIGLVVDDAIVVLENVHRHLEEGKTPFQAAIIGTKEIAFAVIAMTLTLAAVYAPVAFSEGRTGRLFIEFALALAGAVMVSGFVALTLTPMMCSKLLKGHESHGRLYNLLESAFNGMANGYRRLLLGSLKVRFLVVLIGIGVGGCSYLLFTNLKSELSPIEDRSTINVFSSAPEGSTLDFTDRYATQIQDILLAVPEVGGVIITTGWPDVTQASSFIRLENWEDRERSQQSIVEELQKKLSKIAGVRAFAINRPAFGQSPRERPVQFVLQTTASYQELEGYLGLMMEEARKYPGFVNLDDDLKLNKPQLDINVDREKAADMGIPISVIGRTLETLLGGRQVTRFNMNGEQYDVLVQVEDADRRTPGDLNGIYIRTPSGQMVQFSNLASVREVVAPRELNRFNQLRSATITANIAPGYALGEALEFLNEAAARVLPANVQTDLNGQSREYQQSGQALYVIFLLALAFIYLVLAAQFESFIDPFIIVLTVPLSMTGALAALYFTGNTVNIYSQIGLITLVGLITKHGILIVEFSNQLQERGMGLREAVVEAAVLRLRPILMTTGAMVLGAVPLAVASGAGAESRQAIGWVIVGGMTLGTLLTLFVVPTAYTLLARPHKKQEELEPVAPHPSPAE